MPNSVTKDTFQKEVLEASSTQPVVVDFWAPWCGPCIALAPIFEEIAKEYEGKATFVKLNVDEEPAIAGQYGVMSIPTTLFFKNGKPATQIVGLVDKSEIITNLEKVLGRE